MQQKYQAITPEEAVNLIRLEYLEWRVTAPDYRGKQEEQITKIVYGLLNHLINENDKYSQNTPPSADEANHLLTEALDSQLHIKFFSFSPSFNQIKRIWEL